MLDASFVWIHMKKASDTGIVRYYGIITNYDRHTRIHWDINHIIIIIIIIIIEWINNIKMIYKNSKKAMRRTYTRTRLEQQSRKYQIEKHQTMIAYIDSGFKNIMFMYNKWTQQLSKYPEIYSNGWRRGKLTWFKRTPKKEPPPATTDR